MNDESALNKELEIPESLQRYIVDQNYQKYTWENQSTWRYIMRQLKDFLSEHAHPSYLQGLKETGITTDKIPRISDIDQKLQNLGWRAVPVSGFIPPKAFMEFQLKNILPIASDIRTVEHINYTPAPDIVHEAAGHAPFLIEPVFNSFLKKYAKVVRKAITNKQDFKQYSAIRQLSDVKEDVRSTPKKITEAQEHLNQITSEIKTSSEASLLSRFIWFTSEYGLIGNLKTQKIYGAGLISSIGEAKRCLGPEVKKIMLDSSCVNYPYDITNYQSQLFVTPNFETLHTVLEDLEKKCAFSRGEEYGLDQAKKSETVCTIELNTGLQISGILENYVHEEGKIQFIKLKGSCQLSYKGKQLEGHGVETHSHGYSSPLGILQDAQVSPDKLGLAELQKRYLNKKNYLELTFHGGWTLKGKLLEGVERNKQLLLLRFKDCEVRKGEQIYYQPEWGLFDLAIGELVPSVFGGPADRVSYKDLEHFEVTHVSSCPINLEEEKIFSFYQDIRNCREGKNHAPNFNTLFKKYKKNFSKQWLAGVELLELAYTLKAEKEKQHLTEQLISISKLKDEKKPFIKTAIELIQKEQMK